MLNQFDHTQIFVPRGMEMMIMLPWAIQLGFQMMRPVKLTSIRLLLMEESVKLQV